jgi:hypothetical protein
VKTFDQRLSTLEGVVESENLASGPVTRYADVPDLNENEPVGLRLKCLADFTDYVCARLTGGPQVVFVGLLAVGW